MYQVVLCTTVTRTICLTLKCLACFHRVNFFFIETGCSCIAQLVQCQLVYEQFLRNLFFCSSLKLMRTSTKCSLINYVPWSILRNTFLPQLDGDQILLIFYLGVSCYVRSYLIQCCLLSRCNLVIWLLLCYQHCCFCVYSQLVNYCRYTQEL